MPPEVDRQTDLNRLSDYFAILQALVAEHVDEGLIGADVSAVYPEALRHHLEDDWLHHLRDDALMLVCWDADSLTRHITHSLDEHDRFGAPPVWRYLPSYRLMEHTDPGDGRHCRRSHSPCPGRSICARGMRSISPTRTSQVTRRISPG